MEYIQQFPELLEGKTVLYVHGFGSSGQSGTVSRLRTVFPNARVIAPDLPIHPQEALDLLCATCQQEQPSLIIGTSMGGMYAEKLYGYDRICVNPAMQIADTMQEHGMTGKQQFFSPRQDGVQEFYVDKPLVKEYKAVTEQNFAHADEEDELKRVVGLFGDEDDLVNTFDLFSSHYPLATHFHGEHRMNDRSFMHSVVPVIRWIDDRQEKRQRPIIYIGIETLADAYRKPASSMMKAISFLIEHYQVFFVAPSPWKKTGAEVFPWLNEHVGIPAWCHTITTDRRDLLYGDYLIEAPSPWDRAGGEVFGGEAPLCTLIDFGSDTFKTWEDIIEYFSRLGGQ